MELEINAVNDIVWEKFLLLLFVWCQEWEHVLICLVKSIVSIFSNLWKIKCNNIIYMLFSSKSFHANYKSVWTLGQRLKSSISKEQWVHVLKLQKEDTDILTSDDFTWIQHKFGQISIITILYKMLDCLLHKVSNHQFWW